mmetsp:Transcript_6632/g.28288  ORF Transcript_6632/g.28288 Transcript_6632/m.28288 type:complete len:328 (+) Transcript_6632:295-1278(+)
MATSPTVASSPETTGGVGPITSRTKTPSAISEEEAEPSKVPTGRNDSSTTTATTSQPTAAAAGPASASTRTTNALGSRDDGGGLVVGASASVVASRAPSRAPSPPAPRSKNAPAELQSTTHSSSSSSVAPSSRASHRRASGSTPPLNTSGSASPAKSRDAAPVHSSSASAASADLSVGDVRKSGMVQSPPPGYGPSAMSDHSPRFTAPARNPPKPPAAGTGMSSSSRLGRNSSSSSRDANPHALSIRSSACVMLHALVFSAAEASAATNTSPTASSASKSDWSSARDVRVSREETSRVSEDEPTMSLTNSETRSSVERSLRTLEDAP